MTIQEMIRAGRLTEARVLLSAEVKAAPADAAARTLLFQVLAYLGEWTKAERHLDVLAAQGPLAETGVQVYRDLIKAEQERLEVFRGERSPCFMTETPGYFNQFLAFRSRLSQGLTDEAARLLGLIEQDLPLVCGEADGAPFSGFSNADSSLAPFLEVMVHDRYLWVPIASLLELSVQKPATLLELLWIPARLVTRDGLTANCFLPVLYPDSASHGEDAVRLGRMTDWQNLGGGFYRGLGQQTIQVGEEEKGLLELGDLTFSAALSAEAP